MTTPKPKALSAGVASRMRKQRSADTKPEMAIRRLLFASGVRYRVHLPVPGNARRKIDIAFPARRIAVFIDGCFWHGCALHKSIPKQNGEWWRNKIDDNRQRDSETVDLLSGQGWTVLRFWEHEAPEEIARAVLTAHALDG